MKERCFVFKLVDHDKQIMKIIDVTIYDNKVMEWLHTENNEEYAQWLTQHILWEKKLKKHVKHVIVHQHIEKAIQNQLGGNFGDFRLVKKAIRKEYVKVNMNKNADEPFLERKVKYMEKYITKLERGQKTIDWPETLRYPKTSEYYSYLLESNELDDNIKITSLAQKFILNEVNVNHVQSSRVNAKNSLTSVENSVNKKIIVSNSRNPIILGNVQTGGKKYPKLY